MQQKLDIQIEKDIVRFEVIESTDKVIHELTKEEADEIKETLHAKLEEISSREGRASDRERYEVAFVSIPEK